MTLVRLRRNVPRLKELKLSSVQKRKKLLLCASSDLVNAICDCCLNARNGNLKISAFQKRKLAPYASTIRALSKKKQSVKKRREILLQKGGFLPSLLIPVLSLVALLNKLVRNG